jgi:uncharacterized membrane protein YjgN (DUF898 family)
VSHLTFGNLKGQLQPGLGGLIRRNIITLLLVPLTLGLSRFWYRAAYLNHVFSHTKVGSLGFISTYTGGSLLRLVFGNIVILMLTLGLGFPIIVQRNLRHFSLHVALTGDISASGLLQSAHAKAKGGEGVDGLFGQSELGAF